MSAPAACTGRPRRGARAAASDPSGTQPASRSRSTTRWRRDRDAAPAALRLQTPDHLELALAGQYVQMVRRQQRLPQLQGPRDVPARRLEQAQPDLDLAEDLQDAR